MSFLSELKKQKDKLKETETVVTKIDGVKYIEGTNKTVPPNTYGFVVDTKPDDVPVLVVEHMFIGSQDCAEDRVLQKYNIKHVLSLGIEVVVSVNQKFVYILDLPEIDIVPVLKDCLLFMRHAIENKENVLVHCNAGVSRTSMVAIAYLMHYHKMQFDDAYKLVKEKRPAVQPNRGFIRALQALKPGQITY